MLKATRILYTILSWLPIIWLITILMFAYDYNYNVDSFDFTSTKNKIREILNWILIYYYYFGFYVWILLTVFLTWKKAITKKQLIICITVALLGICLAFYALEKDFFGVSGGYLD